MKTVIEIDQDIIPTLFDWHGGQWDPVYAVASSLYAGHEKNIDRDTLSGAIHNLERDYEKATWASRADKKKLRYAIDVLKVWYDSLPEQEYEMPEVEELNVWEPPRGPEPVSSDEALKHGVYDVEIERYFDPKEVRGMRDKEVKDWKKSSKRKDVPSWYTKWTKTVASELRKGKWQFVHGVGIVADSMPESDKFR